MCFSNRFIPLQQAGGQEAGGNLNHGYGSGRNLKAKESGLKVGLHLAFRQKLSVRAWIRQSKTRGSEKRMPKFVVGRPCRKVSSKKEEFFF